jgi:predicted Rossmann fold nucleotide-binding protein DprA/Smf involved in DNA uptake
MNAALSPNTQAILLLTAPLSVGRATPSERPLGADDYSRLAAHLRGIGRKPADFLDEGADALIHECRAVVDTDQVRCLLARGFLLGQAVERWSSRALWVISRADPEYPRRLKARMNEAAPAVLYGCGDVRLLESGGLAVVGSHAADDSVTAYAEGVGLLAARCQKTLVSGGARGIDQAAMRGALQGGGSVVGVLASGLETAALSRENREALLSKRLALASPNDPSAGFDVAEAMQRNKLIYALADAGLVVSADIDEGDAWVGATEQLEKLHYVRVYVRSSGTPSAALDALKARGALPWPNPADADQLAAALRAIATRGPAA